MIYKLEATGQFFEICAEFDKPTKLKKELTSLKMIHQNEVKRIIQRHNDAIPWWIKKRRKRTLITDIVPEFQPLKITITTIK